MRRFLVPVFAALALLIAGVFPASAVTGGRPDGNGHPYSALLLVPGETFCSGTLIAPDVVLTAGHCTWYWTEQQYESVQITFDPEASVDEATWTITGGTWYEATEWVTHPGYVDAEWPFTYDYGLVLLDEPVVGITPAQLPEAGELDPIVDARGQTQQRFNDVGYGVDGVTRETRPYQANVDFVRKVSTQRYFPGQGSTGNQDPRWLMLNQVPSANHGSGCGGDSGSGIFYAGTDQLVAIHTGGYNIGYEQQLCGRITSLNHRLDLPEVLDWIEPYV